MILNLVYRIVPYEGNWLQDAVKLMASRFNQYPLYNDLYLLDDIIQQKLDTTSPRARIEAQRFQLTNVEIHL